MAQVVSVARGGVGQPWLHDSVLAADQHPIHQFGDPILGRASDLARCMSLPEMASLADKIGDLKLAGELRGSLVLESDYARTSAVERLWDSLVRNSPRPPADPKEVIDIVVADRRGTRVTGVTVRRTETMTEEAAAATEAAPEKKTHRPIPKEPKFSETSIVKMKADKDGKPYGADNNPKKAGSASHTRFALYKDGATVKESLETGLTRGDLSYDKDKGFIDIV